MDWNCYKMQDCISKGQLISKCPFGVFKSPEKIIVFRIAALASKKVSNQKNKGTLYVPLIGGLYFDSYTTFFNLTSF